MWGTTSQQDQQSFAFADYILEPDSNLCLITPCDLGTRLNVTNGKYSTLDLSLVSYSLALSQHVKLAGAVEFDHLPLILQLDNTAVSQLNVVNQPIRLDDTFWYIGLIFDSKMTLLTHIEYLLGNIRSILNLINVMCLGKRGAPFKYPLSKIIKAVIVSKLDYGSFIYGNASQKNPKKLDTVFHSVLRQSIGCLNSTPIPAMMIELGVSMLRLWHARLIVKHFTNKSTLNEDMIKMEIINNYNSDSAHYKVFLCFYNESNLRSG